MSEWITDRNPTIKDGYLVYRADGTLVHWSLVPDGEAWKPVARIEPYVKPKRYEVDELSFSRNRWLVRECQSGEARCHAVPTREAAERIAAIYEEVMP